ncbi:HNH endonuclease signature motif containing protein [Arthrobacter oryzae]|uniref:HNH endonuclease signature motif containing protein n=1 Tax=Arthrobacter oryzae TaxID=409290 RepID=UPI00273BEB2B|nr:HNH endonuclease signature motif containing protein [Arthrobacter oryzae]WLQ07648.1 DUF222 domain-containing protein [Arthrobacter oryzae]
MDAVGEREATEGVLRWATWPAVPDTAAADLPSAAHGLRILAAGPRNPEASASDGVFSDLARSLQLLKAIGSAAVGDAVGFGVREAADFAADVEEISRAAEFLQVVAAGAVDRTRRRAQGSASPGAAAGWTTGWGEATAVHGPIGWAAGQVQAIEPDPAEPDPADDGYRNAAEFLRGRLRISAVEARRRISLAEALLPSTGITGHHEEPARPVLAAAVAAGTVASRAATIITLALDRVRHHAPGETVARMEHMLTSQAAESDADLLSRVARHWVDGLDQDGSEPSEEELRRRQGVFLRRPRRGLQHFEVFATPDQFEPLLTAMNTATNPRTQDKTAGGGDCEAEGSGPADPYLDLRTRPQRLLDGLVGATKAGLSTGDLPAAGGMRPQVMVTIDYRDLLGRLGQGSNTAGVTGTSAIPGTGSFTFTGPVTASTVRKIACDADIIPVLLGSQGRILDIGRTTRIFPPHIRKALTARDQGCAFPGCTIPAPWCEAHHITYWSHGGTTSTDNGTLLCSHHHHLIHKEQWQIQVKTGIPWFIPPPHIDPRQKPQRNHYFRC